MDKILSENLFLLEFLVDRVNLNPGAVPCEIADVAGETCVSFKFLDNEPLDICEADFTPTRDYARDSCNTKSGKSCLFAVSQEQARKARYSFDVDVAVFKKLTNGCLPDKIQIGTAVISIASIFDELIESLLKKRPSDLDCICPEGDTLARTLKDSFPICGPNKREEIGCITVFIRMSCFGKLIVTQFQMNLEEKSVFFKDKEGKSLYKYRKASKSDSRPPWPGDCSPCPQEYCQPPPVNQLRPAFGAPGCDKWNDAIDGMGEYNPQCTNPCCVSNPYDNGVENGNGYSGQTPASYPVSQYPMQILSPPMNSYGPCPPPNPCVPCFPPNPCVPCLPPNPCIPCPPPSCIPCPPPSCMPCPPPSCCVPCPPSNACYHEVGAEMNGNALKIRVHKDKNMTMKRIENGVEVDTGCYCGGGNQQPSYPTDVCCTCPPPLCGPCGEKQILSMRPADDPSNPFTFKLSGCPNGGGRDNITICPPTNTRPDGMQVTEISDPNKDVFVLRIGKKSEGADKKANLELELVTPKGIEKKPIPRKESRDAQYDLSDIPPKKKGGKAGKSGKGGKGGKKGKKKK